VNEESTAAERAVDELVDLERERLHAIRALVGDATAIEQSGPWFGAKAPAKLVAKIAEAMLEAGEVTKDQVNPEQNYKYASAEAILGAVRIPLLKRGVVLLTSKPRLDVETIQSKRGTAGSAITVSVDFTFIDGESGESLTITDWKGQGQDYGDKAIGKAYTNAVKTFIRMEWLLPTGDDPEAESPERVARGQAQPAAAELPAWALAAKPDRVRELTDALTPLLGARRTQTFVAAVNDTLGKVPAVVVSTVKPLAANMLEMLEAVGYLEAYGRELVALEADEASKVEAAKAQAAAEAPDAPSPEPESQEPPPSAAEIVGDEEPPPGTGEVKPRDRPAAGSVKLDPPIPDDAPGPAIVKRLKIDGGCTCKDPLAAHAVERGAKKIDDVEPGSIDNECPVHGIPF
jgi:hypothetical protein